ncbi:MAG: LURP-one-related family protein [bacterium]|nr:LURP-one-related family protein [bacterium]
MKLFVKEKLFSIHNRYYIYNENDEIAYEIESKAISIGDKTTIYDKNHNIVAYIEQEWFHFMPHYNVYIENNYEYQIKKKFNMFKNDYELSNSYKVEGSILNLNFTIINNFGKEIAIVNRKFLSIGDKYQIEILDEKDVNTILTIIVAITNDVDRSQANSSSS